MKMIVRLLAFAAIALASGCCCMNQKKSEAACKCKGGEPCTCANDCTCKS